MGQIDGAIPLGCSNTLPGPAVRPTTIADGSLPSAADCSHIRFCVTSLTCANGCVIAYSGARRKLQKRPARQYLRRCSRRTSTRDRRQTILLTPAIENRKSLGATSWSPLSLPLAVAPPDRPRKQIRQRTVSLLRTLPTPPHNAPLAVAEADEAAEAAFASRP